jgi:hypothetical protein
LAKKKSIWRRGGILHFYPNFVPRKLQINNLKIATRMHQIAYNIPQIFRWSNPRIPVGWGLRPQTPREGEGKGSKRGERGGRGGREKGSEGRGRGLTVRGLGEMGLGEMGLGEMGLGKMGLGEMGLGEMGLGEMGLGEMGLGEMGLGEMGGHRFEQVHEY